MFAKILLPSLLVLAFSTTAIGDEFPPVDDPAMDDSAMDDSAMDDSAMDDSAMDDSAMDDSAMDDPAMDDPCVITICTPDDMNETVETLPPQEVTLGGTEFDVTAGQTEDGNVVVVVQPSDEVAIPPLVETIVEILPDANGDVIVKFDDEPIDILIETETETGVIFLGGRDPDGQPIVVVITEESQVVVDADRVREKIEQIGERITDTIEKIEDFTEAVEALEETVQTIYEALQEVWDGLINPFGDPDDAS